MDGIAPWSSCVGHLVWPGGQGAFTIGVGCVPSGYVKIAIENGPVEIVDLPSYIAWWIFPVRYVNLPGRVTQETR